MSRRLRANMRACHNCELGEYSDSQGWQRVPWAGSKSNVAIIGEAPGKNEALEGAPFVGRAGQVLDDALRLAGISRSEVWIQNVIACRPPKNDFAVAERCGAVDACRPWFNQQLDASNAWLVVLVGKRAYQAVMDRDVPLSHVRGRFEWFDGRLWFPTWHPAYVLRQGPESEATSQWKADWRAIGRLLEGEDSPPPPDPVEALEGGQLRFYEPETGGNSRIKQRLELDGWVGVWSPVIEDYICVVNDERSKKPKIPARWKREPRWTTTELAMVSAGNRLSISVEEFRRINLAKRVLGGKVVA